MITKNVNNDMLMQFFIPTITNTNKVTLRLAEANHKRSLTLALPSIPFKEWNRLKENIPLRDLAEIEAEKEMVILKSRNGSPYFRKEEIELIFSTVSGSNKLVLKTTNTDLKSYLLYEPRSELFIILLIHINLRGVYNEQINEVY